MSLSVFLTIFHILGTVIGFGGALFAEIFSIKLQKESRKPTEGEVGFLRLTYTMIRLGLIILVLSGFGYFLSFRLNGRVASLADDRFWAKMVIVIVLVVNALLMQTRKIPMWLGSAISLTLWSAAMILGAWRGLTASFTDIMIGLVVSVAVAAIVLAGIKRYLLKVK